MTRRHVHFATGVPAEVTERVSGVDELVGALGGLGLKDRNNDGRDGDGAARRDDQSTTPADATPALPADKKSPLVLSGMRNSSTLLVFLDLERALREGAAVGLKFWMSANGVVLCEGGEGGVVPTEFFGKVVERGGKVLLRDGKVVQ